APRPYTPPVRGLLLLLLAGCGADVCAPFDGHTCIALTLSGDPALAIDRLGIGIEGVLPEQLSPADSLRDPPAHLPIAIALLPGDTVSANVTIEVRALLNRETIAQAVSPLLAITPLQHRSLS